MLTTDELLTIQDLPEYLRTDHCYNDLQHAMLVILFRHALTALKNRKTRYADQVLDNATLYLYIHFLNEEEGMVYKSQTGLIDRDNLKEHCEMHVSFLEYWKSQILMPHKSGAADVDKTIEGISKYYNLIINHIATSRSSKPAMKWHGFSKPICPCRRSWPARSIPSKSSILKSLRS